MKKIIILSQIFIFIILIILIISSSSKLTYCTGDNSSGYGSSCPCNYCTIDTKGAMTSSPDSLTIEEVASGDGNIDPAETDNGICA
jgi:hypothetical protein